MVGGGWIITPHYAIHIPLHVQKMTDLHRKCVRIQFLLYGSSLYIQHKIGSYPPTVHYNYTASSQMSKWWLTTQSIKFFCEYVLYTHNLTGMTALKCTPVKQFTYLGSNNWPNLVVGSALRRSSWKWNKEVVKHNHTQSPAVLQVSSLRWHDATAHMQPSPLL